ARASESRRAADIFESDGNGGTALRLHDGASGDCSRGSQIEAALQRQYLHADSGGACHRTTRGAESRHSRPDSRTRPHIRGTSEETGGTRVSVEGQFHFDEDGKTRPSSV